MRTGIKIGFIYSGISYQYFLLNSKYKKYFEPIYIYELPEIELTNYDILIIPRGTDQEFLVEVKDKIIEFLNSKRVLICFGEIFRKWLPTVKWNFKIEDGGPIRISKGHPIFYGIPEKIPGHTERGGRITCSHGHLKPPKGVEILATTEEGKAVMYVDKINFKGILVISTALDADCHAGFGDENAMKLLDNLLNFAEKELIRLRGEEYG